MRSSTVKSFYHIFPVIMFLMSCSETNNKAKLVNDQTTKFKVFIEKFPSVSLPITIRGCTINTQGLPTINGDKFVSETVNYGYGKLEANNKYITVVFLANADCETPVIVTYDNYGNKIDEKEINVGRCGSDCGYSCNEIMQIDKDNNIFTADTIFSYTCDSLGNAVAGTEEHYVIYKLGKILETGKIRLSTEIKKQL